MKTRAENQKGVSLIITFFIMVIILAIVLSVSALLYSEIKVIRNMGNSTASFYAADSGIEKVLYYDRQVVPNGAIRGLCSMYLYDPINNPNACPQNNDVSGLDSSIYCSPALDFMPPVPGASNPLNGCDPGVCDDCTISFNTIFNSRTYSVTANVYPSEDGASSNFEIKSKGVFGGAQRQIKIAYGGQSQEVPNAPVIRNASATPHSVPEGTEIDISADISDSEGVDPSSVIAHIQKPFGTDVASISLVISSGNAYDGTYAETWVGPEGAYYVIIDACDTLGNCAVPYYVPWL